MEDLKIYTIDELFEKGRGPDRVPRRRKKSGLTPYEETSKEIDRKHRENYEKKEFVHKVLSERVKAGLPITKKGKAFLEGRHKEING